MKEFDVTRPAPMHFARSLWIVWLAVVGPGASAQPSAPPLAQPAVDAFQLACMHAAVIGDKVALQEWVAEQDAHGGGLLAPLSPGARRRFLASLSFYGGETVSLDTADLEAELTMSQAYRLLTLFGWQWAIVGMPDARVERTADREVDAWRHLLSTAR